VTPATAVASDTVHAFDALRAGAMLLGVVLHASISYMTCRMPNLLWAVHDQSHAAFDWLFWWIHSFRLPLFFLIAGYFSSRLWERRGADAFLANRARRMLGPLAVACLLVLPATYVVWSCGWLLSGQCSLGQALRIKFATSIQRDVYGLAHLWFLEHLFLMCAGYWLWRKHLAPRCPGWLPSRRTVERLLAGPWRPLAVALPAGVILLIDPAAAAGFHNTFVPDPLRLAYYSLFFAAGTLLHGRQEPLTDLLPRSGLYLALSVPLVVSMGLLLRQYLDGGLTMSWRCALAADIALTAALSVFGWLGLALRLFNCPRAMIRLLADASYWIYLAHLPLVGLVQVALYPTRLPIVVKFAASVTIPLAMTLLSYCYLVLGTSWAGTLSRQRSADSRVKRQAIPICGVLGTAAVGVLAMGCWQMRAFCFDANRHVVLPGRVYRSQQPSTSQLRASIRRWSLRSVVNLQGGDPSIERFALERRLCQAEEIQFLAVDLPEDGLPSRRQLLDLVIALERAQAPVLVHGRFGIGRSGLAAAVARLLAGEDPQAAKQEFSWRQGSFTATRSDCRRVIDLYASWLTQQRLVHSPQRFRGWACQHYGPEKIILGQALARRRQYAGASGT
jgi:hypothetical protein